MSTYNSFHTGQEIDNFNSRITTLENTTIPNLDTKITTLENTTIPNLDTRITTLEDNNNKVLWKGAAYMHEAQTITLSETITSQKTGIVLIWSGYDPDADEIKNYNFFPIFIPKQYVQLYNGYGITCFLGGARADYVGVKYVNIYNDRIVGDVSNTYVGTYVSGGLKLTNNKFVLRSVIGV